MINAERAAAGVGPLRLDSSMSGVAAAWSQSMVDAGELSHNPGYATRIPGGWSAAAENVARNSPAYAAGLLVLAAAAAAAGWRARSCRGAPGLARPAGGGRILRRRVGR